MLARLLSGRQEVRCLCEKGEDQDGRPSGSRSIVFIAPRVLENYFPQADLLFCLVSPPLVPYQCHHQISLQLQELHLDFLVLLAHS